MKGLATSAGVATAIILGLLPWRAGGEPRGQDTTRGGSSSAAVAYEALQEDTAGLGLAAGAAYGEGSQAETKAFGGSDGTRYLQQNPSNAGRQDDALDINGSPDDRALNALEQRQQWAAIEYEASRRTRHINLGDRSSAASFHKTLPHDELGQVDVDAFDALIACVSEGTYEACESVPAGDDAGYLVQPIGGIAVDMAGPASSAVTVPSAPAINSEDLAAQLAEVYWMSLTRDVPFSQYGENEDTIAAADNLATMPGFANMKGVAVDSEGRADPQSQLFRSTAVGVETGPFISQKAGP